jgi:hypothetical protein
LSISGLTSVDEEVEMASCAAVADVCALGRCREDFIVVTTVILEAAYLGIDDY